MTDAQGTSQHELRIARCRHGVAVVGVVLAALTFWVGVGTWTSWGQGSAWGQTPAAEAGADGASRNGSADEEGSQRPRSLTEIIFAGGSIGVLILLALLVLSLGAVALAAEHVMTIRQTVLMPAGLGDEVRRQIEAGNVAGAADACRAQPSFLGFVMHAGLAEAEGGWSEVEKALEDATAEQSARLLRKTEYLAVIGNIAPMVGLLGTVMGMIFAFQKVAETQGAARAPELAEGIYTALVTTVGGLLVAIPSLGAFAIFRNRVDQLVAESAYAALHALGPLKRNRRPPVSAPTPAPPPVREKQ